MADEQAQTSGNKPERDEHGRLLPGNTANPNGRPKGSLSLVAILKTELEKEIENEKGDKTTYAKILISKILKKAIAEEDVQMIKDILNRVDGMPHQSTDITSGGRPIPLLANLNVSNNDSNKENSETGQED